MELELDPDPGAGIAERLGDLVREAGLVSEGSEIYDAPWRRAALSEGVERSPGPDLAAPPSSRGAARA